jgi:hypothetical protein
MPYMMIEDFIRLGLAGFAMTEWSEGGTEGLGDGVQRHRSPPWKATSIEGQCIRIARAIVSTQCSVCEEIRANLRFCTEAHLSFGVYVGVENPPTSDYNTKGHYSVQEPS